MVKHDPHSSTVTVPNVTPTSSQDPIQDAKKQPAQPPPKPFWKRFLRAIASQWFIIGLGIAVVLAYFFPSWGSYEPVVFPIKSALIAFIFLCTGVAIKTRMLRNAAMNWPVHVLIQGISFGIAPALFFGFSQLESNQPLRTGQVVAGCLPTAIASTVVMTAQAGGNDATAVINATLGNLMGVIVSPSLLLAYLGQSSLNLPYAEILLKLAYSVVAPLIVGQILQFFFPETCKKARAYLHLPKLSSLALIVIIWTAFCRTFASQVNLTGAEIGQLFGLNLVTFLLLFLTALLMWWMLSKVYRKADRREMIPIVMCSPAKTLALGITLITLVFGDDPDQGIISIPLLLYQPMFLFIQSFITQGLKWTLTRWPIQPKEGTISQANV